MESQIKQYTFLESRKWNADVLFVGEFCKYYLSYSVYSSCTGCALREVDMLISDRCMGCLGGIIKVAVESNIQHVTPLTRLSKC